MARSRTTKPKDVEAKPIDETERRLNQLRGELRRSTPVDAPRKAKPRWKDGIWSAHNNVQGWKHTHAGAFIYKDGETFVCEKLSGAVTRHETIIEAALEGEKEPGS